MAHHASYVIGSVNKLAQRGILAAGVILTAILYPALKMSVGDFRASGKDDRDQLEQIVQGGVGVTGIIFDFIIQLGTRYVALTVAHANAFQPLFIDVHFGIKAEYIAGDCDDAFGGVAVDFKCP